MSPPTWPYAFLLATFISGERDILTNVDIVHVVKVVYLVVVVLEPNYLVSKSFVS